MKKIFLSLVFVFSVALLFAQAPVLGTYPAATVNTANGNIIVSPAAAPANTTSIIATTTSGFKGILHVSPATGVVTVTNAYPAGSYTVAVIAFNGAASTTASFNLTVNNPYCSQANFSIPSMLNIGVVPTAVGTADFNGDGKQDIISVNTYSNTVTINAGNGSGAFTSLATVSVGSGPLAIAIADFNGDGRQDFATANSNNKTISVRLGNGDGSFTPAAEIAPAAYPICIAAADFNGDGRQDLAITSNNNTLSILPGNGAGGFGSEIVTAVGSYPLNFTVADFNNDGLQDIAVVNVNNNNVSVATGNGSGSFPVITNISMGSYPLAVAAADFNGDGKPDLAVTNNYSDKIYIRLGNGTGGFAAATTVTVGSNPYAVSAGDFNGDGKLDIASANYADNTVSIRTGNGTGGFAGGGTIAVGAYPKSVAIGDFNADGLQDVAVANSNNNTISVALGTVNEINITGNSSTINNGDGTPDVADNTDFGSVSTTTTRSFVIQNTGTGKLTISNIVMSGADSSQFAVGYTAYPVVIAAGSSIPFTIKFIPASAGLKQAFINVMNDDCDESQYSFAVQGTGISVSLVAGAYPDTAVVATGGNIKITPFAVPANIAAITAFSNVGFKGVLHADTATGVITVTNAQPAGNYPVTVRITHGFNAITKTFVLKVAPPACSQALFGTVANLAAGTNPRSVVVGDFNNDGRQDIVSVSSASNSINVCLGDGAGGFSGLTSIASTYPWAVSTGDFNGDGKLDLVTANYNSNSISFYLGNGSGNFTPFSQVAVGTSPGAIATGDFNNDGKTDFAVANYNSSNISIRLGDGEGGISGYSTLSSYAYPVAVATGDFNADGNQDLAIAANGNLVAIRLGDGTGNFGAATNVVVGTTPYSIAVSDFNNDGKQDLAVANNVSNTVSIRLGNGAGGFSGTANIAAGTSPVAITVADCNGDNRPDLLVTNYSSNAVSVRLGDGAGGFTGAYESGTATAPYAIATGDFNGDGRLDYATACLTANVISVRPGADKEIEVLGNNATIVAGNNIPDTTHYTSFGNITVGNTLTRTFTIQNTGIDTLRISGVKITGTDSLLFTTGGLVLPATILAGASRTFTVTFTPTGGGVKTARVNILNNDCDESVYDFAIRGGAVCASVWAGNVWLGNSADWNLPGNWSLGSVPNACTRVVVNAGVPFMPEIISPVSACYSLTLNNGAIVTVKTGGHLNITANN